MTNTSSAEIVLTRRFFRRPIIRAGGAVAALLVLCGGFARSTLEASSSKFFQSATQADVLKGDVENLSVDDQGRLVLGPATELIYSTSAPFLWALTPGPDGSLFVGTGSEGKVFRIDAQGKGSLFFDAPELEVHALAPAPNGGLYVATSPDGRIYKVDRDGKDTVFFDPDDKYIWSLALDARGNLFAGTGEKGIVYKIAPDGTGAKFYETKSTHATALAFDAAGNLLVGTGSPGRVLRVDAAGKGFVLLDSPYEEIRALRVGARGMIYVAALNGRAPSSGAAPPSADGGAVSSNDAVRPLTPSVSVEVTSFTVDASAVVTQSSSPSSTRESRRGTKGAVYRIAPDGLWDQVWESRDDAPYDLAFAADGAPIVATGNKGKIYRLDGDPVRPMLLARGAAQQVTAFHQDARGRLYYATANPGKLFRLAAARETHGSYESDPRDAQMVSAWGAISWRGSVPSGSQIELFTRSGNTETPDDTWSAWSTAYRSAAGSPITSPKARYLQWRAVLTGNTGGGPILTSVTAAYLQRNLRPIVRSITVHPPGIVFQKPFATGEPDLAGFGEQSTPDRRLSSAALSGQQTSSAPALGRRAYQKGLETLIWKADDENDDELMYDVLFRREGETGWKALRRGLTDPILVWDTTTVPNGTYFVKIVASDLPSNPSGTALAGELDSTAFEIDNTPPVITVASVKVDAGHTTVTFDVKDDHSAIQKAEFSLDGQRWRAIFPTDGVADSINEHYELVLDGELDERGLTLRASDVMNNISHGHVDAPTRRR